MVSLAAVSVPTYLISFSLLGGTALGVVFVIVALLGRPKLGGPPITIHLGKIQVVNCRPRTLVLLVGTALLVAPLTIAVFQRDAAAKVSTPILPTSVTDVETLPEDEKNGLTYVSDTSVLDLRSASVIPWYRRAAFWDRKHTGPVRLTNIMRIRLDAPAHQVTMTYGTSGTMSARCLTHPFSVRRLKGHVDPGAPGAAKEAWQIVVPLTGIPVGGEFDIVNEVTYWNAFWREHETYTTYENAQDHPEQLSTAIVFADGRPFKQVVRRVGVHGDGKSEPVTQAFREFSSPDRLTYYWQIVTAAGRSRATESLAFTIEWDW